MEFIGSSTGQEASLVPAAGYRFHAVRAAPFRRELSVRSAAAPFVALGSVATSRPLVRDAAAVLGVGGYASIAPVIAARSVKVPTVLHEQNAVPGLANRLLARVATAVALTFETARTALPARLRTDVTGLPLRPQILEVVPGREALAEEARRVLDLHRDRTTVLVTGGSQGALHIDRAIAGAIPFLAARADLQLLVLAGAAHGSVLADVAAGQGRLLVRTLPYLDRMELALAMTDVAIARAGANTIHELAVCAIPSILVPYPHATDDHQAANAKELELAGAAEILLDRELTADGLAGRIVALVDDMDRRRAMATAAAAWAKPDADERVAALVRSVARR